MGNPLKVSLENIIPLTFARDHFSQIVSEVQQDKLFVLTKGGKPAVAIIDVKYLEDITGGQVQKEDIKEEIKKAPEKVGLAPMVEHVSEDREQKTENREFQPKQVTPQPPLPKPVSPTPSPIPPKPINPPPPTPIPKPEPKPIPKPAGFAAPQPPKSVTPPPPQPKTQEEKTLVMPQEQKPLDSSQGKPATIPNKPLTTLPPVNKDDIDVQFSPDVDELSKKAQDGKTPDNEKIAPDDENSPAQYAGEKENPPAGGEPEPEDMALD